MAQWPSIHCGIIFSFKLGTFLLIIWDATKASRKPTLTGWVVLLIPYAFTSPEQKEAVHIFIRRLEFHWQQLYFIFHWYLLKKTPYKFLLVQFSCMAGTSQSCNHVRECSPITFVMLTRFCLLTKADFVCFFVDVP